jgi:chromosome segregation ATPase
MGRLMTKLQANRSKAAPEDAYARIFSSMEKGVQDRLAEEARASIHDELVAARKKAEEAQAETARVTMELESRIRATESAKEVAARDAETTIKNLKEEASRLAQDLNSIKDTYESKEMNMEVLSFTLGGQVKEHEDALAALEAERTRLENARLEAQETAEAYTAEKEKILETHAQEKDELMHNLSMTEQELIELRERPPTIIQSTLPPPSPVIEEKIPEFVMANIMRGGHNDRIISATLAGDDGSEFNLANIMHGHDSKIVSATITPVVSDD